MKTRSLALAVLTAVTMAGPAAADDTQTAEPETFPGEWCLPLDGMMDTVRKVQTLDAHKRDRVQMLMSIRFELEDGERPPQRVEIRAGDTVQELALDPALRAEQPAAAMLALPGKRALCVVDPARTGRAYSEMGMTPNLGMRVGFTDTPGTHDLEGLRDGLKDGRSHYKKMVGAMGFMVPKFTHIAVAGPDEANPPAVFATRDGMDLGEPEQELYDGARLVPLKALEAMGADGLRIEGPYRMSPSPDAKTVAKFTSSE